MFLQSAFLAILVSQLVAAEAKHKQKLTPEQTARIEALVAALTGGVCAIVTSDPLGGALTVPIVIRALLRSDLPKEIENILKELVPLVSCAAMAMGIPH